MGSVLTEVAQTDDISKRSSRWQKVSKIQNHKDSESGIN